MPCVQKEVGDDHEKEYIKKFTDLTFKQKIGDSRRNKTEHPVEFALMSLVVLESNATQMTDNFKEVLKNADRYREAAEKEPVAVVAWHQVAKEKPKSSPKRKSLATANVGQKNPLRGVEESIPSPTIKPKPPPRAKKIKKKKISLIGDEIRWVDYAKCITWKEEDLEAPDTDVENFNSATMKRSDFLNRILSFNKRLLFSDWLTGRPPERMQLLSDESGVDLTVVQISLVGLAATFTANINIDECQEDYNREISIEEEEKRKENVLAVKRRADKRLRATEMADAKQKEIDEIKAEAIRQENVTNKKYRLGKATNPILCLPLLYVISTLIIRLILVLYCYLHSG